MSSLFGTNTLLSTWRQTYPVKCVEKTAYFKETLRQIILDAQKNEVITNAKDYDQFVDLFDNMDQYCTSTNTSLTIFAFNNTIFNSFYKNLLEYDKLRVVKAHTVDGVLTPNMIVGKYSKITNLSRKTFYIDPHAKIFKFLQNEPIIISNIESSYFNDDDDHSIIVYFIDVPLFNLDQLYLDDMS